MKKLYFLNICSLPIVECVVVETTRVWMEPSLTADLMIVMVMRSIITRSADGKLMMTIRQENVSSSVCVNVISLWYNLVRKGVKCWSTQPFGWRCGKTWIKWVVFSLENMNTTINYILVIFWLILFVSNTQCHKKIVWLSNITLSTV